MTTVELWCGVYGPFAGMFPVVIGRTALVDELQSAIYTRQGYAQRYRDCDAFTADELALFVAREPDGAWLVIGASLEARLQGDVDTTSFTELQRGEVLSVYFDGDTLLPDDAIHVLVVLPSALSDDDLSDEDERMQRKRYVHSEVGSVEGHEIMDYLNIQMEEIPSVPFTRTDQVQGFDWASTPGSSDTSTMRLQFQAYVTPKKEQQRLAFAAYLEPKLGPVLKTEYICVAPVPKTSTS